MPSVAELLGRLEAETEAGEPSQQGDAESWLEELVPLYGALLKRRLEADLPVNGRELLAFADLELRLRNQRQVKRLNELTRGFV